MNKTALEMFAEYTIKNGGKWWLLEENKKAELCKSQMFHLVGNNYFGDPPVFQVFDCNGKRIYSTTNICLAYSFWESYIEKINKDICYGCEYGCTEEYEKEQCDDFISMQDKDKDREYISDW